MRSTGHRSNRATEGIGTLLTIWVVAWLALSTIAPGSMRDRLRFGKRSLRLEDDAKADHSDDDHTREHVAPTETVEPARARHGHAVTATLRRARLTTGIACLLATWVVLWLALWALAPAAIGWKPVVITSDSMRPAISAGDIIVARPHPGTDLAPGAVVVFDAGDGRGLVTHRIVAVNPDGTYVTRGDANGVRDSTPLHPDQIVGVGTLRVPLVGLPILWLHAGAWVNLLVLAVVLAAAVRLAGSVDRIRRGSHARNSDPQAVDIHPDPEDEADATLTEATVPKARGSFLGVVLIALTAVTFAPTKAAFADATATAANHFDASWQLLYDVAVTDVRAPATARANDLVCIEVDVANLGSATATFVVEVNDTARNKVVGSQTVTDLPAGDATTLGFSWTPGGPAGTAVIEAEAVFASDEDLSNNLDSTTMTVTVGGPPGGSGC